MLRMDAREPSVKRARGFEVKRFPPTRRLVTAALRAGNRTKPMHGILELDVTEASRVIEANDLSFTAFVIAAVARAVARHPEVQAYRNMRGRLVIHRHVDVGTIVEVPTSEGFFPLVHLVRDADVRNVADITGELRGVKAKPFGGRTGGPSRIVGLTFLIPGFIRAMYAVASRSARLRQRMGTVSVTAVGMFAEGGGFAVAPMTLMSLQVVVGGRSERPRVVDAQVAARTILDLTVSIDHNIVDGGPATRFGAELRRQIETAPFLHELHASAV
jgi:pyruvate/2-oxoglutarate dehydrogenase complex dihydrolipoamide acyltransferase (E2) component